MKTELDTKSGLSQRSYTSSVQLLVALDTQSSGIASERFTETTDTKSTPSLPPSKFSYPSRSETLVTAANDTLLRTCIVSEIASLPSVVRCGRGTLVLAIRK